MGQCQDDDFLWSLNHALIVNSDDLALQACGIILVKDRHIRLKYLDIFGGNFYITYHNCERKTKEISLQGTMISTVIDELHVGIRN